MLRFTLSDNPHGLSCRTVRDSLFDLSGGTFAHVKRAVRVSNLGWNPYVATAGGNDVTLTVRPTTSCEGTHAVCTEDGRRLGGGLTATVAGPGERARGMG